MALQENAFMIQKNRGNTPEILRLFHRKELKGDSFIRNGISFR